MSRNHVNGAVTAALGFTLALSALPMGALATQADTSGMSPQPAITQTVPLPDDAAEWHQSGTCEWNIVDGVLTVRPQGGATAGTLGDFGWTETYPNTYAIHIKSARFESGVKATTLKRMFYYCGSLESVDFSGLDASQATDAEAMFEYCSALKSADLSHLDVSNVTNMQAMFAGCMDLESVAFAKSGTSSATNMMMIFSSCRNLSPSVLPTLDLSHVTNLSSAFAECRQFKASDIYGLNTSSVQDFSAAFYGCTFDSFVLSRIDTSNATCMSMMFADCHSLNEIDLSGVTCHGDNLFDNTFPRTIRTDKNTVGFMFPVVSKYVQFGGPEGSDPTDYLHYLKGWWSDGAGKTYDGETDIPSADATYYVNWQLDPVLFDIDLGDEQYTGKPITKSVRSWFSDYEYEVSYSDNVQPGTATITITGVHGLVGSATYTFKITGEAGGQWVKSGGRWWYRNADGSYPASAWKQIDGKQYWFDASGYMATGWQKLNGTWYWFDSSGVMATGWQKVGGSWYYFDVSGAMATGWQKVGDFWYYLEPSGSMATGWRQIGSSWYYLGSNGVMTTGLATIGGTTYFFDVNGAMSVDRWEPFGIGWEYFNASGARQTGWLKYGGSWYWFNDQGVMKIGWQKVNGSWYYFDEGFTGAEGAMKTGWFEVDGIWYYADASGAMAHDRWQGDYYLTSSGAMATNQWIDGCWVGSDGKWVPGA